MQILGSLKKKSVLDDERTEEAFTIHQSQLLRHRTIEDMFFSNNNINQLMIFQTKNNEENAPERIDINVHGIYVKSVSSYYIFAVTLLMMGLTISWNATAANGPMFAKVVPAKHRTMIYAFDRGLKGCSSSFAAPIVGILAEQL
ncbi:hypothetical protein ACET3Z_012937 [Daucus carota]